MSVLVVIDTNVLVAALLSKHPDAATVKVLEAVFTSKITPIYNDEILTEYAEVLSRDKFHFSCDLVATLIQSLRDNGISVERINTDETLIDPNDLVFYEVCLAKQDESAFLVTGNLKHFPKKPFIVSPQELMRILI